MSINLKHGGWNCWRSDQHSGKSPAYLVAALLNIPLDRAKEIVGESVFIPENFLDVVKNKISPEKTKDQKTLKLPKEFRRIDINRPSAKHFVNYLRSPERGFSLSQIASLSDEYGLRYCKEGRFNGRIIFPVWYDGSLVTWTGRTIYPHVDLRYKTLETTSDDPKRITAAGPITDYLLWYDQLIDNVERADTLILCEGPFDSLKVSVIGRNYGIESTCFTTATPSSRQIQLAAELAEVYPHRYLLLDRGTLGNAIRTAANLRTLNFKVLTLPPQIKDPGLLTKDELIKIIRKHR